VDIYQ